MNLVLSQLARRHGNTAKDFESVIRAAEECPDVFDTADILLLPELIGAESEPSTYRRWVERTAGTLGCSVVGGSHHTMAGGFSINSGVAVDARGNVIAAYEKRNPYGCEVTGNVRAGNAVGQFTMRGRNIIVGICSDIWFSKTFHDLTVRPDLVLIPSFSISTVRPHTNARQLWQHMTISRAYEYNTYVGVSDWAYPCDYQGLPCSGVSGLASPRSDVCGGETFFMPVGDSQFRAYRLDFGLLDELRESKRRRGFL